MSAEPTAELGALLLADGRLPTGSYSHSAGLEPAVRSGLTVEQIPDYLEARLRTVGLVEATAAVLARRQAAREPSGLAGVQAALLARTPSAALRTASGLLGRGLQRLGVRLFPDHPGVVELSRWQDAPLRPVALGVVGAAVGMDERQVARASLYDDLQTVTAAALKLLPVDPVEATGWVLDSAAVLEAMVGRALAVHDTADLPALAAPVVEQWSLDHETSSRRIFVA
ncbi:urease accessory protein UreF [Ornithinimicrobium cavernae]|uniref:urease accessory protein UreF n=1 Tax=Ornithinimicrobium cavernae TaxID=2666047 RepID=UPI000D694D58|nr:urease accessory UreF family protein [Ornithinimicrobium cavernae]